MHLLIKIISKTYYSTYCVYKIIIASQGLRVAALYSCAKVSFLYDNRRAAD